MILGFLPIETTIGDRIFIGAITFIGIHLLWLGFIEDFISIWGATGLGIIVGYVIIKWG